MKKNIIITIAILLGLVFAAKQVKTPKKPETKKIGILQMVSHPALDQAREGFLAKIRENADGKIECVLQNAEGSMMQARSIAQSFHSDPSIDAIFAIATGAAQTAVSLEKQKPIFFSAITDPKKAGILQQNSCGTSDLIDVEGEVRMLKTLFPKATKVAIPYNPAEINSASLVELFKKELALHGLEAKEIGIHHESEVASAISMAAANADVLLVPTDNLMANSFSLVAATASRFGKAVIASDNLLVEKGALAAKGVDYFESGKKTGAMAIEVLLQGKSPKDFPLLTAEKSKMVMNGNQLKERGIEIPIQEKDEIVLVNEK